MATRLQHRKTTTLPRGIEFRQDTLMSWGPLLLEDAALPKRIRRVREKVAVINEAFARKFFQNEDPIGKHFGTEADNSRKYEVVGIAKDARYLTLDQPDGGFFFLPEAQADYSQTNLGSLFLHDIVIRTRPGASLS
jgi:MacB-like periplasmic core domain